MTNKQKSLSEDQQSQKIQSLREMITSAETTIHGAKAMLLQLEGKKKVGRKRKIDDDADGHIVQGAFTGQVMIGTDGKQYPVPANYASKSKLVEGDLLKLVITPEGQFIYKQIGPVPRRNKIGIIGQDAAGNFFIAVEDKSYKVLLASVTFFDAKPGDEVVVVISEDASAQWASIENLLQHNDISNAPQLEPVVLSTIPNAPVTPQTATEIITGSQEVSHDTFAPKESLQNDTKAPASLPVTPTMTSQTTEENSVVSEQGPIVNEWVPDIEELEREIRKEMDTPQQSTSLDNPTS